MSSNDVENGDDRQLFLDAIGKTKPLKNRHVLLKKKSPKPHPKQHLRDEQAVLDELLSDPSEIEMIETGEHLAYTQPGVQKSVLRKLRSGRYSIQDELDLHGLTRGQAKIEVVNFISLSRENAKYCVRIIHGKGRKKADAAPILKPAVNYWLIHHKHVLAFCSAPLHDGGTGALYALLKR